MIVTCRKKIPFLWILFALLPWSSLTFTGMVTSHAVIFSLKRFVENPAALTFILSLPAFLAMFTVSITNFVADRIWTRFGRRKPFVITGLVGMVTCLFLMPLMPNFWSLVAVYVVLTVFMDLKSPIEALKQEIVPPPQRGQAAGLMAWINQAALLVFMFFIFGRFDDVHFMAGVPISGETGIYWSAALMGLTMAWLVMLGTKETKPNSSLTGQRLSLKTFFGGLLDRELLPIYVLIFGSAVLNSGLGPLSNLLYTDQWGYTKQDMGTNVAVGGVINLFIIAGLAMIADRLNRLRAYQVLILLAIAMKAAYFAYVHLVLPDRRPTLVEIIFFGESMAIISILTSMVYGPLVYDYIVRNKMGTYAAGASLVTKATQIITVNGAGLFITGYATFFLPPAGEMTRVALKDPAGAGEMNAAIASAQWIKPGSATPISSGAVHSSVWNADGTIQSSGRGWELRYNHKDSEKIAGKKQELSQNLNPLMAQRKDLADRAEIARREGDETKVERLLKEKEALTPRIDELTNEIAKIQGELDRRAEAFRSQVAAALAPYLAVEGSQIIAARPAEVLVLDIPTRIRPDHRRLERLLVHARAAMPDLVDLVVKPGAPHLELSLNVHPGMNSSAQAETAQADFSRVAAAWFPALPATPHAPPVFRIEPAAVMKIGVIERPIRQRVSPITTVVNAILSLFDADPPRDQRMIATARSLRLAGETSHVGARPSSDDDHAVEITALIESGAKAPGSADAVSQRLESLLAGSGGKVAAAQFQGVYTRAVTALAAQNLTVRTPVVTAGYGPPRYDYMVGYFWMIILGLIGFGIVRFFVSLEKRGIIHKRGVEEAEATL